MKKRHIRQARKLCEEYQREMNSKSSSRSVWTAWPDVHIIWKRMFYERAMKEESDKRQYMQAACIDHPKKQLYLPCKGVFSGIYAIYAIYAYKHTMQYIYILR